MQLLSLRVEGRLEIYQLGFHERMTNFERMSLAGELSEFPGKRLCECLEGRFALLIVDCRRPHPSDTQRRFPPSDRGFAVSPFNFHTCSSANDSGENLAPEFQGYPHLDR